MKVSLKYLEGTEVIVKKLTGISEIEIRQGFLEFWVRNNEGEPLLQLSIPCSSVQSMICFKHIAEKNNRKVKERKARVKRSLNKYSRMIRK